VWVSSMEDPEPSIRWCNVINAISAIKPSKAEKAREKTLSDQFNLIINVSLCFSSNLTKWHICRSKYHGHKRGSTFLVCFDTLVDLIFLGYWRVLLRHKVYVAPRRVEDKNEMS
jgi:hypothetical protein